MGCSNPHPHCQVWSMSTIPSLPAKELENLKKYTHIEQPTASGAPTGPGNRPCLLCEYAHFEINADHDTGRMVTRNHHWVAVVPWWAVWPFEVLCKYVSSVSFSSVADIGCQCSPTLVMCLLSFILQRKRRKLSPKSCWMSQDAMTTCSHAPLLTRWAFINVRLRQQKRLESRVLR